MVRAAVENRELHPEVGAKAVHHFPPVGSTFNVDLVNLIPFLLLGALDKYSAGWTVGTASPCRTSASWRTKPKRSWTSSATLARCAECAPRRTKSHRHTHTQPRLRAEGTITTTTRTTKGSGIDGGGGRKRVADFRNRSFVSPSLAVLALKWHGFWG